MRNPLSRPNVHSYVRTHLHGAAAGVELFRRSAGSQTDPQVREALAVLRDQVVAERREMQQVAADLGASPHGVLSLVARFGTKVGQLKPNGHLVKRTAMADLIELETLRDAVAGKTAGWEALLEAADRFPQLDAVRLRELIDQSHAQLEELQRLHRLVAPRALSEE
ncbi:hypothetical protein HMPREF0063_10111 [Aeromicrobium marinum DSM 15272]|uniref:DUF2383 domain-containing protein n=1 Tax=Aeromicrobium marinum DSM 15272 TaxID=585531 RepID=E2S7V4_9ACTN|nr:hypothetical protein [Aeromicrobium marinum]EFQ84770.1 hypothetical protein HMPREF0063_10111 [Aeromicrobium marinum DSM 15272]